MPPDKYIVGLIQMAARPTPTKTCAGPRSSVREAAAQGAQVVCLPELFRTQYFCQREDAALFDLAEPIPGPTTEALARRRARDGVVVVASLFERRAAGRLPQHRGGDRRRRQRCSASTARCTSPTIRSTTRSTTSRPAISASARSTRASARIGTLVCWDQWYPEGARLTALQGARRALLPDRDRLASGEKAEYGAAQHDAWRTIQRAHAIANGVYVAAVNRVGHERRRPARRASSSGAARSSPIRSAW